MKASNSQLVHHTEGSYGGSFLDHLVEQCKALIQSADNASARRVASNRYLLTLNSALVALYGFQSASFGQSYWLLLVPITGIVVSLLSYQVVKSYQGLNAIKFKVIQEIEAYLPASPFAYEWRIAEHGKGVSYNPVTRIERWIPIAFLILHLFLSAAVLINAGLPEWIQEMCRVKN